MSFKDKVGENKNRADIKHSDIKPKNFKGIGRLDAESILQLLEVALALQAAIMAGKEVSEQEISKKIPLLMVLFEYLSENMDNPNFDRKILRFLEQLLGLSAKRTKEEKEKEAEEQEEEEKEVDEQEKERRLKLAIYEMYKILNPHRLAGETELDNFINNVKTRGIKEALKYEGSEFATKFDQKDLENLESHRFGLNQALKDAGMKGGGRGM